MEHWVPLFHERMETLLDYLPGASVSLDHQAEDVLAARLEMIEDHYIARRAVPRDGEVPYRPLPPGRLYLDRGGLGRDARRRSAVRLLARSPSPTVRWASMAAAAPARSSPRPPPWRVRIGRACSPAAQRLRAAPRPGRALGRRGRPRRDRRLDPRLARAAGASAARARRARRRRRRTTGQSIRRKPAGTVSLVTLGIERGFVARHASAVVGEQDLLGTRISRPVRTPQAGRPVHRRGHRNRRGRPRRAPGIRHRPLRRAGDAARHRRAARLPEADLRRRRKAVSPRREHRGAVALRLRPAGRRARQAGRHRLAVAQGADEEPHPRHGGRADPHRRRRVRSATPRSWPRRRAASTSSAPAFRSPKPKTSRAPSPTCWKTWRPAARWTA